MPPGLSGDLSTMPLQDVVLYLGNRQLSGKLIVSVEHRRKVALVAAGQVISTSSSDPREYLSQFMINFGHLTEDQVNKAMKFQAENKLQLGRALTQMNLVNEDAVRTVLTLKTRETLLEAFRWSAGTFSFEKCDVAADEGAVAAPVALLDLHREGEFRETAWEAIRQVFPTGTATLKLDESRLGQARHSPMDQKLFDAIREGQSIDEMVFSLHTTDFHLYQRVYALYRQGAVAPGATKVALVPPSPAPATETSSVLGEETPIDGLLNHARSFLGASAFAEAEVLCQRILEMSPQNAAALELVKEAEKGLHEALREQFLNPPRTPELAVDAHRIRGPDLSPPEKYLLSRIDGTRDIRAIVNVAPLRELEALKYFQRFIEGGLVRLRA